MIKVKSFMSDLFDMKCEKIYTITKKDKKILNKIKNNTVDLNDILKIIKSSNLNYEQIKKKIEILLDDINIEHSYQSQKIYKYGFSDGIKMMLEVIKY